MNIHLEGRWISPTEDSKTDYQRHIHTFRLQKHLYKLQSIPFLRHALPPCLSFALSHTESAQSTERLRSSSFSTESWTLQRRNPIKPLGNHDLCTDPIDSLHRGIRHA